MPRKRIIWGYGQRVWIDFLLVVSIIGLLIYFQTKSSLDYIINAELVGPVYLAMDIQMQLMLHSAISGNWPDKNEIYIPEQNLPKTVDSYHLEDDGGFLLRLNLQRLKQDNQQLAFNLYTHDAGKGYQFYTWRCGEGVTPRPYQVSKLLSTTIPLIHTNTVCRQ